MRKENLEAMPLANWEDTLLHWQLMVQIVGKVRMKLHPFMNHWWHVPLYVSPRGLTTGAIPLKAGMIDIEFDLMDHRVSVRNTEGEKIEIPLGKRPVCEFYEELMDALDDFGAEVKINPVPFKCRSVVPFAEDTQHKAYDAPAVARASRILREIEPVLKEFRSRYVGKCSPVHMFWHGFDLAVTRFSGRSGPDRPDWDPVNREAYSHEVISTGFWFGDNTTPEPMFYCYTYPAPDDITKEPLGPAKAFWGDVNGSPYALLRYEDLRQMDDPRQGLLDFMQSSYEAGAKRGGWDRAKLERT
ncbi:MAG: hypothetical protein QOJ65_233 [Fimbriimonadaceae bacterium]|jgi:hypothetical protein|nr:hypothetical protein [Fimbriimonadaceae bacterium]